MVLTHITSNGSIYSHLAWIRVIGNIKSFHNKKSVTAARIHLVTDMSEIFYHQLEALSVHLYFTKGPLTESGAVIPSTTGAGVPSAYSAGAVGSRVDQFADFDPLQREILLFMKNTITDENGSSVIEIANAVKKTGASADKISCVHLSTGMECSHSYPFRL
jgi:replication factor A2